MLASLADSTAALRRMLTLASPPPFLAATVISRRIFEKSLPRCTSALPFLRLICDHRECPDIALPSFVLECGPEPLHPFEPELPPDRGLVPAASFRRGLGRERRHAVGTPGSAVPGRSPCPEVDVGQERRAGVPHLARPRALGHHLHADLERGRPHVVQCRLEDDHLVREDR